MYTISSYRKWFQDLGGVHTRKLRSRFPSFQVFKLIDSWVNFDFWVSKTHLSRILGLNLTKEFYPSWEIQVSLPCSTRLVLTTSFGTDLIDRWFHVTNQHHCALSIYVCLLIVGGEVREWNKHTVAAAAPSPAAVYDTLQSTVFPFHSRCY